jgi:DNA-binding NarL/FixJ family response regulator
MDQHARLPYDEGKSHMTTMASSAAAGIDEAAAARPHPIRVLVCGTDEVRRTGLRTILSNASGIAIIGEADNESGCADIAGRLGADVVLLDVDTSAADAIMAIGTILAAAAPHDAKVIALSTRLCGETAYQLLRAGARGLLSKIVSAAELVEAIRLVGEGGVAVPSGVLAQLVQQLTDGEPAQQGRVHTLDGYGLTSRQVDVLQLVAQGRSNTEIARELYLSISTVKSHLSSLLRRLDLRDRTQLAVFAHRHAAGTLAVP